MLMLIEDIARQRLVDGHSIQSTRVLIVSRLQFSPKLGSSASLSLITQAEMKLQVLNVSKPATAPAASSLA